MDKISREFTMKKRIRQRLIERESFLPFGSVKFDTRDTSHNYQTDLQKMFEDLKAKVLEENEVQQNGIDPYETEAEEEEFKKKKKFFDSVTSCQDKNMFTDVETDNEYGRTDIGSDSSEDDYEELEIEINPLKIPSLPSLIFTPEKPSDSTMVTRTVQKLQDGGVTEDEHHADPLVKIPEDRKQPGRQPLPEEEKEKPEEPPEFGAAAFSNKEEIPKIVPKPSKKTSEPLFGKKIVDKVNLPPIEVNNSKVKKNEESKEKSSPEASSSGLPSSSQSLSRDRVQDESDCNYDSDASLYDPMAMFKKRDKINPPSDGNKTSIGKKEDSSKFRSEENRRDRLRNDRHYDDKYDHDYRDRRRPTRSGGRQRSDYDDREYDRRREEYDSRRDDRDRRREERYQDEDRTRSARRSDSRDRSPEKPGRSRDRSPVRTRSKPVRDRTRSPDRKSKRNESKIVEKESRSRKRSHSSDEEVDKKSKKSKKKDRSPKSRKTSTDDILNEILVVDKKPDDLKARMMARMAKQKSREQTPTQEKEPTPIRSIKSPDPLAESEVFVKTKEKKKSKESKKSSSSSEPTFFVKLDKKIDLKMNENNSNSSREKVEEKSKNRDERRESKRLKSKKESKTSRKRRSRSPEEPEENQKEKEMAERMKKRAARFKQPPPAVTLVTPVTSKVDENRTLERIIGDDAPDDVIIDDITSGTNDSMENFKMSKNFENIKNRLLDRAPKSSMLPKSSSNYEDDDDDDDVISIADSEVSLATTVLLNSKDVQDKRNGF